MLTNWNDETILPLTDHRVGMVAIDDLIEVIVYGEDMDRMVSFYTDVMGFEITEGDPEHGFVRMAVGRSDLCFHAGRDGEVGDYAPKLVFEVDDLEETGENLREHDVGLGEVRNPTPGVRVLGGVDPEGNTFSFEARE